jgi:tetratricopeptide (TPR) repeat protein
LIAQHFEESGEATEAVRWHARAAVWAGFSDPEAAREQWRRIRDLDPDLPATDEADNARATARTMLLALGWRIGADLEEAREHFAEGKAIAERRGDKATLALLHGALGIAEATSGGSIPEYVRHAEEALRIGAEVSEPNARVAIATLPYYALFLAGRHDESLASVEHVLELTADDHQLGAGIFVANPHAWATSFRTPSLVLLGRFPEARRAAAEGAELCKRHDHESLGWTHGFYVNLAIYGGDPPGPDTVAHGRQAVQIAESLLGDGFSRVLAHWWLGSAYLLTGEPDQAMALYDLTLELISSRGVGRECEAGVIMTRASAMAELGRIGEAIEGAEHALRVSKERGTHAMSVYAHERLARHLLLRDTDADRERAGTVLAAGERFARALGQRPDLARTLRTRAALHLRLGDRAASDRDNAEALALAHEMDAQGLLAEFAEDLGAQASV